MPSARLTVLSWFIDLGRRPAHRGPPEHTAGPTAYDRVLLRAADERPAGGRMRRRLLAMLRLDDDGARRPVLSWLTGRSAGAARRRPPAPAAGDDMPEPDGLPEAPDTESGDRMRRRLLAVLRLTDVQRTLLDALPVPVIVTRANDHQLMHANPPGQRWLDGYQATEGIDLWSVVLDEATRERFLLALETGTGAVDALPARWSASGDFATATRLRLSARRFSFGARPALLTTLGSATEPQRRNGTAPAGAADAAAVAETEAERRALRATLGEAAAQGELRLRYQPRIDASSGRATSVEALVEWLHPEHGLLGAECWEAAEPKPAAAGAASALDPAFGWALARACSQWRRWHDKGLPGLPIALRVPPGQPVDDGLVGAVERSAAAAGIPPGAIELELPEPALAGECAVARATLERLQAAGCVLSIGCFGTGRLSLEALHGLPIGILRIDASLVRALRPSLVAGSPRAPGAAPVPAPGLALVGAIVELGRALGVRVGAHGVVHPEEEAALHAAGCDELQGALYGLPMSSATCAEWLGRHGEVRDELSQTVAATA